MDHWSDVFWVEAYLLQVYRVSQNRHIYAYSVKHNNLDFFIELANRYNEVWGRGQVTPKIMFLEGHHSIAEGGGEFFKVKFSS